MKKRRSFILISTLALVLGSCTGDREQTAQSESSKAPAVVTMSRSTPAPGASVFFITPTNGATTSSPVEIKFGISGMAVMPAGEFAENSGHHHLLVDTELMNMDLPVPKDDNNLHFGKGQTETVLALEPGQHTLQLVLGDGNHIPHDPPVLSDRITITVE